MLKLFVTGGTGYVGQPIVQELVRQGHQVTVLTRGKVHRANFGPQVTMVEGDISDENKLQAYMAGADGVIHLVGIIRESLRKGITMQKVHVEGTKSALHAAQAAFVRRFVHMSALGARPDATSAYHQSKWHAEQLVRQSGLDFTIFRPSIVFGSGGPGDNFISILARLVQKAPILPVLGDGQFLLQPVHVSTVAEVFCRALGMPDTIGETYELGGPDVVTYIGILHQLMQVLQVRKQEVHIPMPVMEVIVLSLARLPAFPLTKDQFIMLKEGNVCSNPERVYEVFGCKPISFELTRQL